MLGAWYAGGMDSVRQRQAELMAEAAEIAVTSQELCERASRLIAEARQACERSRALREHRSLSKDSVAGGSDSGRSGRSEGWVCGVGAVLVGVEGPGFDVVWPGCGAAVVVEEASFGVGSVQSSVAPLPFGAVRDVDAGCRTGRAGRRRLGSHLVVACALGRLFGR